MTIEAHDEGRQTLKRRGLIAGAAALAAGALAKQTSQPVAADTFAIPGNYVGNLFSASVWSISNNSLGNGASGISGLATSPSQSAGVLGYNPSGTGVSGSTESNSFPASGLFGIYGQADSGIGVAGKANTGVGVRGTSTSSVGVYGVSTSGIAVRGESASGTGIYGATGASYQYGILGTTYAANSTAIAGTCVANGSSAFSGGTANPNAYAGVFQGNVVIQGRLVVSDPSYKSGVLQHPDGSHRLVYCVESPESWIEDFGEGKLVGGKAEITLDKDFAAVVLTDRYHVFLTEQDEHHHLIVKGKAAAGFTVEADSALAALKGKKATDLNGTFSYRIVAKPKTTVKSERLGTFVMPNLKLPDTSALPAPTPAQPTKAKQ